MQFRLSVALALCTLAACPMSSTTPTPRPARVTLSILGTNDIHGHLLAEGDLGGLAVMAGYFANVRAARAADGGAVLLVDAGDDWQGTMESNLAEGEGVVAVMNQMGYAAMAIGNHDFDFGPVGPKVVPSAPGDDPRGALKARAAQAKYPFLTANIEEEATGKPLSAPNIMPSTLVEVGGVKVGIVGAATEDTTTSTSAAVFGGLVVRPLAPAIAREAAALRQQGAVVVVLTTHSGLCRHTLDVEDVQRCKDGEIVDVVQALPPGAVDLVIAGHTHVPGSIDVNGVPIVEGSKYSHAFDRVDLVIDRAAGKILEKHRFDPREVCANVVSGTERCDKPAGDGVRVPATYEGRPVVADATVAALIQPYADRARAQREEKLGVRVTQTVKRSYGEESAFGNLVADMMLAVRPHADLAITNGGGLRTDLPIGELTYGAFFETYPFDNRFATIRMSARSLAAVIGRNLEHGKGIFSLGGLRAVAKCKDGKLDVSLFRPDGKPVRDDEKLTIATSDFLATGGMEGTLGGASDAEINVEEGTLVREELIALLRKRGGTIDGADLRLFDPAHRRLEYPGRRPVTCAK
jgi:5'-nucleotidase